MPGAIPSSTPTITSPIPPNTKLLLDAIDLNLAQTSPSHSPVHEKIPQHETGLDVSIFANPPTQPEEVTPLELQVTLGGIPSEAATTSVEPTGLHLDSGYIRKTSLEAIPSITPLLSDSEFVLTTCNIKRLSSLEGRRPQYQEKGASVVDIWSTLPISTSDKTTASGKSDDPIKLGCSSCYQFKRYHPLLFHLKHLLLLQQMLQMSSGIFFNIFSINNFNWPSNNMNNMFKISKRLWSLGSGIQTMTSRQLRPIY
ncbi:hypothetical protein Hanom_Chr12g01166291 [Helianthus anomalus]